MDGERNVPAQSRNAVPPILHDSRPTPPFPPSYSPPDFLRQVQAAFKRHRPLVTTQTNNIRPKRILVAQREESRNLASNLGNSMEDKCLQDVVSSGRGQAKNQACVAREIQEDAPASFSNIAPNEDESKYNLLGVHRNQLKLVRRDKEIPSSHVDFEHRPVVDARKDLQLSLPNIASAQETEWEMSNPPDASTIVNQDMKQQNVIAESETNVRPDGGIPSMLSKRTTHVQDQLHHFRNFLQSDSSHPMTQSSVVGSSCATTTLIRSTSAPMVSSTTYSSQSIPDRSFHVAIESQDFNVNPQPVSKRDDLQTSHPSPKHARGVPVDSSETAAQTSSSVIDSQKQYWPCQKQHAIELKQNDLPKGPSPPDGKLNQEKGFDLKIQSQAPLARKSSTDVELESSKSAKKEKDVSGKGTSAPRKRNYDPDLFFKVNGKLYQRLGKIGSGGSSEVHKVISSDCTIYALKKIKLKGRDYATAYGFCQEIEYLKKLKGKNYIIQMFDYEITDKYLLHEVINGSLSNKDSRVKDDAYIYMVLEYGEIDLAHMLSQKWKEIDGDQAIDENWLRFYWQQILLAVSTIHEERIVHSDLKPANFLLVKGSLKLIDFGIAKAIMNDTTNIQRDAQVGTLSYMSPEAFMCNENDADGNTIKCGRPSDIWSLGCILYQMVYGRTPFSEYKTFWAKFKVITDRNHEIAYGPVSNPWLLDLMRKCLAWDRNDRWRIPQLLGHPFLVPPGPAHTKPSAPGQCCKLLGLVAEVCEKDEEASTLYSQLKKLMTDPIAPTVTQQDQCCSILLSRVSECCDRLQQHLMNSGERASS